MPGGADFGQFPGKFSWHNFLIFPTWDAGFAAIALLLRTDDGQTEQRLTQEAAETLQARWMSKMTGADRAHSVAVLDSGAEFQSLTMPADDAQMLESRDFEITELARFFGIPPYLMFQTSNSTSWGTGLEAQATGFVVFDLHPQWLAPGLRSGRGRGRL